MLLLTLPFAVTGCANPGPPKPPSLRLPAPAKDLRADRIGNEVHLSWTTSAETTDGIANKPPLSADICRDPLLPSGPPPCTVVQHLSVTPGASSAADPLPPALLLDPVHVLRYRVRLLNSSGHAADPSNIAFAAAGAAPASVVGLRAAASAAGTRILWSPVNSPAAAVLLARSTPPPAAQAQTAAKAASAHPRRNPSEPVQLRAASQGPDPGGTLDPSSQRNLTYTYIAWRSRTVVTGGKTLDLRSPDSPPLTLTVHDLTPPATPVGLEAIVDGLSVDLSWEPDTEPDLAGYWVERIPASGDTSAPSPQPWQRLNPALIPAPSFRDTPPPGNPGYLYRVLAADTTGNLSQPTAPVAIRISGIPAP